MGELISLANYKRKQERKEEPQKELPCVWRTYARETTQERNERIMRESKAGHPKHRRS